LFTELAREQQQIHLKLLLILFDKWGYEVKVVDAKKGKVQSISEFDLIMVSSGIKMGKWTRLH